LTNSSETVKEICFGDGTLPVLGGGTYSFGGNSEVSFAVVGSGDEIWVADEKYSRVFRIANIDGVRDPEEDPYVDIILGQTNLSGTSMNQGQESPAVSTLAMPQHVMVDPNGNLYVSDAGGEASGLNMRILEWDASSLPEPTEAAVFAIPADRVIGTSGSFNISGYYCGDPVCAPRKGAFTSNGIMVVPMNPYQGQRFTLVYLDPLNYQLPQMALGDWLSYALSASFDSEGNLYIGDFDWSRLLIYKKPFKDIQIPTFTPTPSPTSTPTWDPSVPTYTPTTTPTITPSPTITATPYAQWAMFRRYRQHAGRSPNYAVECGGALSWAHATSGSIDSSPAQASDGSVYIGSDDNVLYAYSETGEIEWSYVTGDDISSSPALNGAEEVYVGSEDNQFYAFDSSGGLKWSYTHPGGGVEDRWESSPVIDYAGAIYIQARSSLVVFDSCGALSWSFGTGAASTAHSSSPAIGTDGRIFWGSGDLDRLYVVDSDCALEWSYRMGDTVESSPAIGSDGKVLIGSYDNNLYAYASMGALTWSYLTVEDVNSSPAVDTSERVYVGSRDNRFYAFTSTGALSWSYEAGMDVDSSPAIDVTGMVYVGAQDNILYSFNSNGGLSWSYVADGSVDSSPAIGSGGRLYVGSNDNNVYALGKASIAFTLYGDADGEENWIAVPFCDTGITNNDDLGDLIGALFSPGIGDTIVITRLIASSQSTESITGTYVGFWFWNNSNPIVIGAMYKVIITLAGGDDDGDLTLTGCATPIQFILYDLSGDNDNENWISLPWYRWWLDTAVEIGDSIAYQWSLVTSLVEGDTLTISVWNELTSSENETIGTYDGAEWSWDPDPGDDFWTGRPFIVRPYHEGGIDPYITWP
jgi:outer membrane protein assembly factor BamB